MTSEKLENLVKIDQLKIELPDQVQFDGMLESARIRLQDLKVKGLSMDGKFLSAYGAAHVLALAAMRWHGYRSTNRYLVFQCLQYTVGLDNTKWRVLDKCHKQRNLAEYEGYLEIDDQLLKELIEIAEELFGLVDALGPVG